MNTVRVDGNRVVSMTTAVLLTILGAVVTATLAWGAIKADLKTTSATVVEHGDRLKAVEAKTEDLREIKNDIAWIKQTMQQERRRSYP